MQKTISTSCYDVIVIKQQNNTYKSTPFQAVFSSNFIKSIDKNKQKTNPNYKLSLFVNEELVDVPIKIDSNNGRVLFEKKYKRKLSSMSDSSDYSDDDLSQKSSTLDSRISKSKVVTQRLDEYKNQQAPSKFWQFAWLFKKKQEKDKRPIQKKEDDEEEEETCLAKIKEEVYEGQQTNKEPLFHLSLCGNLLKKKSKKEQILKTFYENRVEYTSFIKDPPTYLNDSNLVVKIDDSIYTWQLGVAILTCRFAYGKQLSNQLIQDVIKNKFTKSKWLTFISGPNITKLDVQKDEKGKNEMDFKKFQITQNVPVYRYRKTPDSEKLKKMKLKYGLNRAKFVMDFGNGNTEQINMKIFLWDHSQKIIISDIDGTITKSDILGQILSKWIHPGVTKLFTEIYKRNYKIIYLTARAIGQYQQTTKFLETVQEDEIYLPQGPLLMSPDGYMKSFTRQIIYKTPDYLKTKILASLNEVFPQSKNPIFCGFGNRVTDSIAYSRINISLQKIFCISEKSIVTKESDKNFATTYLQILQNINEYFPEYLKQKLIITDDDIEIDEFQLAGLQDSDINPKKVKSEDNNEEKLQLEGFQSEELQIIGNLSKGRKSQHSIPETDIKDLQQFMRKEGEKRQEQRQYHSEEFVIDQKSQESPNKQKPIT